MENFLDTYTIIADVARGAFGSVLKATDGSNIVAIKKVINSKKVQNEIETLKMIESQNVYKLIDTFAIHPYQYLIFEYCEYDLYSLIHTTNALSFEKCIKIMKEILIGLSKIHELNIIHNDIKPANILLDRNMHAKICDFGLSCKEADRQHPIGCGTLQYSAPEVLIERSKYTTAVDIWSTGCLFYEMVTKTQLFKTQLDSSLDQLIAIVSKKGTIEYSKDFYRINVAVQPSNQNFKEYLMIRLSGNEMLVDLLLKMLEYNPQKRITAIEALNHPIFSITIGQTEPYIKLPEMHMSKKIKKAFSLVKPCIVRPCFDFAPLLC